MHYPRFILLLVGLSAALSMRGRNTLVPPTFSSPWHSKQACSAYGLRNTFDDHFLDRTLRLDYILAGDNHSQHIFLSELSATPGWYGRRGNLSSLLLEGNGQITVSDTLTHATLYTASFSTLFQEWQTSEEATRVSRSFENTFLVPFPKTTVDITLSLTDTHRRPSSSHTFRLDPSDILIRQSAQSATPWSYLRKAGDSREKIDIAFVAEGYTREEMDLFHHDCQEAADAILAHEPFHAMADRFNFILVDSPSTESGISEPHLAAWHATTLRSHYDTFYSERYLTTLSIHRLHDLLEGIPYEHIIIMANTATYGGGGIYNSYLMASAHHPTMRPVVVHEFGHSYAGLADEYYYDDQYVPTYPADTEPWEPNITTLVDFSTKWRDMLSEAALSTIPTPPTGEDPYRRLGLFEGGGYQSKGVYRPTEECRMKINEAPEFCPVCQRAIRRVTDYSTNN